MFSTILFSLAAVAGFSVLAGASPWILLPAVSCLGMAVLHAIEDAHDEDDVDDMDAGDEE